MKTVTVLNNQSLNDLAIQEYGSIDGVMQLAVANGLSITDALKPGQVLEVPDFDGSADTVRYYKANALKPSSAVAEDFDIPRKEGIGYWAIETEFKVS